MAAIVDFEKIAEDAETVTYRYGLDNHLDREVTIGKVDRRPRLAEEDVTFPVTLALSGILRGYRKLGRWPDRGAGVT